MNYLLIVLFAVSNGFAGLQTQKNEHIDVGLKSGRSLQVTVSEVERIGLRLDDNRLISFLVISKISTKSHILVEDILVFIPTMKKTVVLAPA